MAEKTRSVERGSTGALSATQVNSFPVSTDKVSISGEKLLNSPDPTPREIEEAFLRLARERFKLAADAEMKRRAEALEDLRFRCGEQWRTDIKAKRESKGRPCHTINRIPEFLNHVVNNMRQSRPAIKIDPIGDGADQENAEIRQGLVRNIERNSQADVAYDTAFENMCVTGLGWMRVVDDWANWDSFDKDLFIRWVENSFQVYSDPTVALPDWSDMKFLFSVEDYLPNEFNVRWKNKWAGQPNIFGSIGDDAKNWFPGQKIRVAEYFYVEYREDMLCELAPGMTALLSDLQGTYEVKGDRLFTKGTDEQPRQDVGRARECKVPEVNWALITGVDILEKRRWKGRYIPFIPVIGNTVQLEGEKLIFGMVRFAREIQRMYNYIYSTLTEVIALAPRNQWVAEMEQIEEFRPLYEASNTDPVAVLPYKRIVDQGQLIPPPQRIGTDVQIAGLTGALQIVDNMLKSIFSIYDASLGQRGPQESGMAINARKIESETATYNWGDNFIRQLRYLGIVLNDLLEPYYNKPGRIVQILGEDEKTSEVTLNQEHVPPGQKDPVTYDLSKGKYSVAVSTGPSFLSKRQDAAAHMLDLIKANPALFNIIGDIYVKQQDWPMKDAIAARIEKTLPPGLKDPEDGQPQVSPQEQQLRAMVEQLSQKLHEALDKKELKRMEEEYETFRGAMKNQTDLIAADLKAGMQQSQYLAEKTFEQLERIMAMMGTQAQQPAGSESVQSGQPPQPQPALASPPTGGG